MQIGENKYPEYPVFKGLQKPLELFGLQGRYIVWAACTVGASLLVFLFGYMLLGLLLSLIMFTCILSFGGVMIFVKQHKGLHTKKAPTGIFIYAYSKRY